jgi:hypothetical protein
VQVLASPDTKTCQVLEKVVARLGRKGKSPESDWQEIRVSSRLRLPVEVWLCKGYTGM